MSKKKKDEREILPAKQQEALDFIKEFIHIAGYPPTISEIMDSMDINSSFAVRKHLEALEKKGYIRRAAGLSRAITIID
jgi:repressor LexA